MEPGKPGASAIALAPRLSLGTASHLRGTAGYAFVQRLGGWKIILPAVYVVACLVLNTGGVWGQGTDDHGDTFATATNLPLGSSRAGRIDLSDDRDVFRLDLSGRSGSTDVWIYTTGDLDTVGWVYDSDANLLVANDDGFIGSQRAGFHIRWVLPGGVYFLAVRGYLDPDTGRRETGSYRVHAQAVTGPGNTTGTATSLGKGSLAPGRIDTAGNADFFRMDFTESTNMEVQAINSFRTYPIDADDFGVKPVAPLSVEVLDAEGAEVSVNVYEISATIEGDRQPAGFIIRDDFGPGTYYFKITTPAGVTSHPVPYTIYAFEDTEYTKYIEECEAGTRSLNKPEIEDPLYACQWHLNSRGAGHVNVEAAWEQGVTGEGVNVAVVDDGMYHTHVDLRDNVDSSRNHDYTGSGDIHTPLEHHGTHVSGIIAARDNGIGVRGVAPRATVYGYNYLAGPTTIFHRADAMARNRATTAVSNNSWGPTDGPGLSLTDAIWDRTIAASLRDGYGGKGVFYAFAAGNGHELGDDSNLDVLANYYGVTAVCAVNDHDTRSGFSEMGANLWLCAPSNDLTDLHQGILTTENRDRYFEEFGGTSAAAPIVAGVAALLRDASPDLTWRDLKLILAATARKNDPDNAGWQDGARKYGSAAASDRYLFNHEYGFGVVDAGAALDLAKRWITAPPLEESSELSGSLDRSLPAPNARGTVTVTESLALDTDISFTEFVEVEVDFDHTSFRDMDIELESPSGAMSKLAVPYNTRHLADDRGRTLFIPLDGAFRFGSARHLGEDPNGEWKLHLTDTIAPSGGTLRAWSIKVYGHSGTPTIPTSTGPETCAAAVTDKSNAGLLADCNALLAARDTLRGTAALNWAADTSIARWDGITLGGSPQRVTRVQLHRRELSGRIPAEIGNLAMLEELWLYVNELSGAIPAELGNLSNLTGLFVSDNNLGGQIPGNLNNLTLDRLWLHRNSFTGCVPYNLTLTREYKVDRGLPACGPPGATPTPAPTPAPGSTDARLASIEGRLATLEQRLSVLEAVVARLTGEPVPTATPTPTPTPTPLPASRVIFGPVDGSIAHDPDDGLIDVYQARGVTTADAIIEARFYNPYPRAEGSWSSGFLFRHLSRSRFHVVVVTDDNVWYHILGSGSDRERLAAGYSEHIDAGAEGSNFIRIVADGDEGTLSVNGHHVADLDLGGLTEPGSVSAAGSYFTGDGVEGESTRFEDFTVRRLTR